MTDDMREAFERGYRAGFIDAALIEGVVTQDVDSPAIQMSMKNHADKAGVERQYQQAQGEHGPSLYRCSKCGAEAWANDTVPEMTCNMGCGLSPAYRVSPAPEAVPGSELLLKISSQLLVGRWASECAEDWPETTGPEYAANVAEEDKERRRKMAVSLRRLWDSLAAAATAGPSS